ncbi:probable receptor-like protein kinase At5g24010 [Ziziphus jujuba]|uniref:Probable receptor-like protein kinase At5g24010 n=1 Tax=Ziziphus jujuba TaxID=326968 RepID=A0A6P6FLC2_ZIZJJ|nr:probable receptor-like protein kinase At5g24010 [Ziziphus jujuba]
MEFPCTNVLVFSLLLSLSSLSAFSYSVFSPVDNYLVDCGSAVDTTVDNRRFVADSSTSGALFSHSSGISLRNENPFASASPIYDTARVFTRPSKYEFEIREKGTHMVRLHFQTLNSSRFDSFHSQFHVLVNDHVVLTNFSGDNILNPRVNEYLIWVSCEKLVVRFIPIRNSKFAFVNAIEVISAPKDLVPVTAQYVNSEKNENFDGLAEQALEVVYRVNVAGPKVTPYNDTLWRTWIPDNEYLESSFGSKSLYFGGRIKYRKGGASREVGPDNVYNTARVIQSTSDSIPEIKITWAFPVIGGYKYLVRMHFCDIASISLGLLYFNVYVNGNLAYKDLDLSAASNYMLASPFYADFVVDGDGLDVLTVSVGPSNMSMAHAIVGILNGVEIMKMNNSMGSLDGMVCAGSISRSWPRGNVGVLVPLVAVVCLLVGISLGMQRRMFSNKDSLSWSKLPVDVSETNVKH